MLKKHWFYCVCASTCCKTICFIVFSLPYVAKTLFLLCCLGLGLQKPYKTYQKVGFSLPNVAKTRFLLCFLTFGIKKWKKHLFFQRKKNRMFISRYEFFKPFVLKHFWKKASRGQTEKKTFILQIALGNRSWSRAARAPARSHARTKRNDFPVGAAALSPPQPPINNPKRCNRIYQKSHV